MNPTATLAAAPVAVWLAVAAAGVWSSDAYYFLVAEDRVFEWIQVGAFAVAAVACGVVARSIRPVSVPAATVAVLWCALFVVVVGEELAWGQRLLGVSVEAVERVNAQGDVTLHNIGPALALSNLGILGIALTGLLARPAARWWSGRNRRSVPAGYLPPVFLYTWFGMAAAFTTFRLFSPSPPFRVAKFSEVAELTVALAAAISTVRLARALASSGVRPGRHPEVRASSAAT